MSLSTQSKIASKFLDYAKNVSSNDTSGLLECILFKSRKTSKLLKIGQKSNILALVAGLHSQKSLKDFGNFQRSSKIIDVCNVGKAGNQYKVKLDSMVRSRNIDILSMVLSRWFSHVKAHQNINTITELKECFERKAHVDSLTQGNGNPGKYNFKVYPRDVPRSERYQVKIKDGIKLFLSYIFIEGKLLASPICSEDLASYNPVAYKETKISDKRSNKYASGHIQRVSSGDALMGPSSIEIQMKRIGMLRSV
ncbi:hypothetical protein BB560_005245 [Smittium megazygosporum]|uniref:Uncharacterized protein n=1 Tax=Smittium megazygosporum TaxID=133381 RepID=A0A2T9Z702_9FUNG|nr:hypothetical protein BB560_005245 [Smittium megazygosporum]